MLKRFLVQRYWRRWFAQGGVRTWGQEPIVRRAINRRVTGSEHVWPVEWLAQEIAETAPLQHAVSLGCGAGALERDLKTKGLVREILGLDLSEVALEQARNLAREAGHEGLCYERTDLDDFELPQERFDAIFAHQSLHHVRELDACLRQASRALHPAGIFYLDEYVGPSRDHWRRELLEEAERVYQTLPRSARRRRRLELPVDWRDPSEAVRSAEIVPLTAKYFKIREQRDYGGNLLSVIHPHLDLETLEPTARDDILTHLLELEEELLASGVPSYYTVILASRPSSLGPS